MAEIRWKHVNWKLTLFTNLQRSVAAGCVFGVVFLFMMLSGGEKEMPRYLPFVMPFLFPIGYFSIYLPTGLILMWLGERVPFGWALSLVGLLFGLLVAAGDPLVFILRQVKPESVPVKDFYFINLSMVLFVHNEGMAE